MGGARKRHHSSDDEDRDVIDSDLEDQEEGEISEDSDGGGRKDSHRKKSSHEHKKSKKKKKDKKSKKKKRRRRSSVGSASPTSSSHGRTKAELVAGDDEASTDREGGSTPDVTVAPINVDASDVEDGEDGEVYDSGERERRHSSKRDKKKHRESRRRRASRSPSEDLRDVSREKSYEKKSRDRYEERASRKTSHSPIESEEESFEKSREEWSRDEKRRRERDQDRSRGDERRHRDDRRDDRPRDERSSKMRPRSPSVPVEPQESDKHTQGNFQESMSIEETNRVRASLGLKPLNVGGGQTKTDNQDEGDDDREGTAIPNSDVRHKPAENLAEKSHIEKMREKLNLRRQKRLVEAKLLNVKTLGESDSDDDSAAAWVKRQAKKAKEKAEAEKRAKALAELDDEFGVGNLVAEETKKEVAKAYGKSDLKGLRVEHSTEKFKTGQAVILTLKDSGVLDEEEGDTLVNVNIMDEERVEKNLKSLREIKAGGYNPYEEEIDPLTGDLSRKGLLSKYDEEIAGRENKKSFAIGAGGQYDEDEVLRQERERIRQKLNKRMVETLEMPAPRIASDFMTEEESSVKFKKIKKKKKVKRKMLKADDLLAPTIEDEAAEEKINRNTGRAVPMDIDVDDDVGQVVDMSNVRVDDEQDDIGLQRALQRARLLKQRARLDEDAGAKIIERLAASVPTEQEIENGTTGAEFIGTFADDVSSNKNIILNETSEFCRHLGAWRANEVTGMGESVSKDILDFESSLKGRQEASREQRRGRWEEVNNDFSDSDEDMETQVEKKKTSAQSRPKASAILEEEPDLMRGVAGAIRMASTKGYLETAEKEQKGTNLAHLLAKSYTIEDKLKDDDRNSRRERYGGPTSTFTEKSGYVPNVQLEYIDDNGRLMNSKEAFRHLSHRFHGKGSGKLKTEKRMKKVMEESMMKNMSSTDTPLQTLEKLRERQKESATPYIVLTGNKINPTDLRK